MNHRCPIQSLLFIIFSLVFWGGCNFKTQEKSTLEFPLPLNLKAVFWGSDVQYPILGLVILDDLNFLKVGKGSEFLVKGDTVEVEKITGIGRSDNKMLIKFLDTRGEFFYIECFKNLNGTENEVSFIASNDIDIKVKNRFNWIEAVEIEKLLQ
jgi:hypothetical protein